MNLHELTSYPVVALGQCLEVLENGGRPTGGVGQIEGGIPSLGGEHLTADGGFAFQNMRYVPRKFFDSMQRGVIQRHDILVVKDGATTGKVAFVDQGFPYAEAAINEHLYRMRPNEDFFDCEYLFWFLFSEWGQRQIRRSYHGGAIGGITKDFVGQVHVPVPPLFEQRRIAYILQRSAEIQRLRQQAFRYVKQLYVILFVYEFGDGCPTAENPATHKLRELLGAPLENGFSPSTSDTPPGIPVFTLDALTDIGLNEQAVKYHLPNAPVGKGSNLEVDDLLISRSNTRELVGRVGRYRGSPTPVIYPDLMIRIHLRDPIDSPFVEGYLRSAHMKSSIRRLARGTSGSMVKISQGDIANFEILWPEKSKRRAYCEKVRLLEDQFGIQGSSTGALDRLHSSLMSRAFTGELTAAWRGVHSEQINQEAAERDQRLGVRAQHPSAREDILRAADSRDLLVAETELAKALNEVAQQMAGSTKLLSSALQTLAQSPIMGMAQQIQQQYGEMFDSLTLRAVRQFADDQQRILASMTEPLRQMTGVTQRFMEDIQPIRGLLAQFAETAREALAEPHPSHPRYHLLRSLSREQHILYLALQTAEGYLRPEAMAEEGELPLDTVQRDLELLVTVGLAQRVNVATKLSDNLVYVPAYRRVRPSDGARMAMMERLKPQERAP